MAHPLKQFSNLRLVVSTPTGSVTRNPITGNYESITTNSNIIFSVRELTERDPSGNYTVNPSKLHLEGYAITPKNIPVDLRANTTVEAYLIDPYTKEELKGEFTVELQMQSRVKQVTKILGNQIRGWFQKL